MTKAQQEQVKQEMVNNNIIKKQQESMKNQVIDLELKARYWKAMHEIRKYTIDAYSLQEQYDETLQKERDRNEKLIAELQQKVDENPELKIEEVPTIDK